MSGTSPAAPVGGEAPSKLTGGAILLVAFLAMALAAVAAWLYFARAERIDGAARVQAHFGAPVERVGLQVAAAQRLPDGIEIVALRDFARVEADAPEVAASVEGVDRAKVDLGPLGTTPSEALLVFAQEDSWAKVRKEHFERVRWKDLAEVPASGGVQTVGEGKLPWRSYEVAWVHERAWDARAGFRDAIRADVSLPGRPASLLLAWPRGARGGVEGLGEFLARLEP
ncbi:MAG: hypothetical protein RIR65_119 [Planctomycetota bacterium]|jgi:hypothetical protein